MRTSDENDLTGQVADLLEAADELSGVLTEIGGMVEGRGGSAPLQCVRWALAWVELQCLRLLELARWLRDDVERQLQAGLAASGAFAAVTTGSNVTLADSSGGDWDSGWGPASPCWESKPEWSDPGGLLR